MTLESVGWVPLLRRSARWISSIKQDFEVLSNRIPVGCWAEDSVNANRGGAVCRSRKCHRYLEEPSM